MEEELKRNREYWAKRFEQIELAAENRGVEAYHKIQAQFRKAIKEVEAQTAVWYGRYAKAEGISLAEAKKRLTGKELNAFRMSLEEYIEKGRTLNISDEWARELEAASARVHISRLEAIQMQLQQQAEELAAVEEAEISKMAEDIYKESYYHSIFEVQKGIGIGSNFAKLDERIINKVVNTPWTQDGSNFSNRIWENKKALVNELNTTLTQGIMRGESQAKIINKMAEALQRDDKRDVGRLVATESAYFASEGTKDAYEELDVEQYEILATLDSHTSEICRDLDGKKYPMKDYKAGLTAPPFHPRCRTTTIPVVDDLLKVNTRVARDKDGNIYEVPSDMTYREWEKLYVEDSINVNKTEARDKEQFDRYQKTLKELAPASLEDFKKVKANAETWNDLKAQYRTLNRYDIPADVPAAKVLELDKQAYYLKQKGFDYSNLYGKERNEVKKLARSGNAAIMEMDGIKYFSHSRLGYKGTLEANSYIGDIPAVCLAEKPVFKTMVIGGTDRMFCTEAKFFEFANMQNLGKSDIIILSEKHICESCENVLKQFKEQNPNVNVSVVSGKQNYNGSEEGTKTWKHRKKIK